MRRWILAFLSLGVLIGITPVTHATEPTQRNRGLYISPIRNYLALDAGTEVTRAYTVANLTDKPITVTTHVEQFSVADYSYDLSFDAPKNDWVKLHETSFALKPYESHQVPYRVAVPDSAAAGGHYYTLYASSKQESEGFDSTVQAASLLYLTINGDLKRSSKIVEQKLPLIVLSPQINYEVDVKNTGNIHYFAYFASQVSGLFYHNAPNGTSQLLMPDKIRRVQNSITSPLIPGIYQLSYTYTPDKGKPTSVSQYIIFLPPWFLAFLGLAVIFLILKLRKKKKRATQTP